MTDVISENVYISFYSEILYDSNPEKSKSTSNKTQTGYYR